MSAARHFRRTFAPGYRLTNGDLTELSTQATALFGTVGGRGVRVKFAGDKMQIVGEKSIDWEPPAKSCLFRNIGNEKLRPFDAVQLTWAQEEQDQTYLREGVFGTMKDGGPESPAPSDTMGMDLFVKTQTAGECLIPKHSAFGRFGIVCDPAGIAPGNVGGVWTDGIVLCRLWMPIDYTEGVEKTRDWSLPDRCDTTKGKPHLQAAWGGAGQILWFAYPDVSTDDPRLALVRIDARNTEGIGIVAGDEDDQNTGIAEVIELPPGYVVESGDGHASARLSHGVILVTRP